MVYDFSIKSSLSAFYFYFMCWSEIRVLDEKV